MSSQDVRDAQPNSTAAEAQAQAAQLKRVEVQVSACFELANDSMHIAGGELANYVEARNSEAVCQQVD
jgi:hypothetical protein